MKDYMKPEVVVVDFASEAIAEQGNVTSGGATIISLDDL